jgi:hypothetical protein
VIGFTRIRSPADKRGGAVDLLIARLPISGTSWSRGPPKNDYGHFLVLIPMQVIWQDGFDAGVEPSVESGATC